MFQEMMISGGGGGNTEVATGTFTVSNTNEIDVNTIGFEPTYLFVYSIQQRNFSMDYILDKTVDANNQTREYNSANTGIKTDTVAFPTTTGDAIQRTSSSGFVFKSGSSIWYGTYRYVAIR